MTTTAPATAPYPNGRAPAGPALNAVSAAIKDRADNRHVEVVDVTGFWGPGEKPIPKLGIRVPTKWEQDCAAAEAHKYVAAIAGSVDEIKRDGDILQDAKAAHIAYVFCREVREEPAGSGLYVPTGNPAFPGPKWMCENIDADRIAVLINFANELRAEHAPSPVTIDDGTIEAYISRGTTAFPESGLMGCTREYMVQLFILTAHKLAAARAEVAALRAEVGAAASTEEPAS